MKPNPTIAPLPCPFCGQLGIEVTESSTFRWRIAECCTCGARCGEVRIQTVGQGTTEEWEAQAYARVVEEWNKRSPI